MKRYPALQVFEMRASEKNREILNSIIGITSLIIFCNLLVLIVGFIYCGSGLGFYPEALNPKCMSQASDLLHREHALQIRGCDGVAEGGNP